MDMDNKLGREKPSIVEFEHSGFVYCDGIVIDNVQCLLIDYCDDEITLEDKNNYAIGTIYKIKNRKECVFTEIDNLNYIDHTIIKDGEVVI